MTFQSKCFLKLGKEEKQNKSPLSCGRAMYKTTFLSVCLINFGPVSGLEKTFPSEFCDIHEPNYECIVKTTGAAS